MILQKVDITARRAFIPETKAPDPIPEAPERSAGAEAPSESGSQKATGWTGGYIFSKRLNKKLFPYKDPYTGKITAVVTEDGDVLNEKDIQAFALIDKYFGIEKIEKAQQAAAGNSILLKQGK